MPFTWHHDMCCTNHAMPFRGTNTRCVNNGKLLNIHSTRSTSISTTPSSPHLNNILHVPCVLHSLLSIYIFIMDNEALFDKGLKTRAFLLMMGFWATSTLFQWLALSTMVDIWHHNLGHPHTRSSLVMLRLCHIKS